MKNSLVTHGAAVVAGAVLVKFFFVPLLIAGGVVGAVWVGGKVLRGNKGNSKSSKR